MRALHLLGLRNPGLQRLRYVPPTDEPLILPSWLPPSDREVLLAFYQQVLGGEPLQRIEVDWDYSLVPTDAAYLRHARARHGAERDLVVVRVRRPDVDLASVVAPPEIMAFQHVAIACDHPSRNETIGRLRELAELVASTAELLYEELADELSLRSDGPALIEPLVRTLVNPIPILEAYNSLIQVQGEVLGADAHRDAVHRSVLGRLLDDLPQDDLVALAAIVLRGMPGLTEAFGDLAGERESALRGRMLLRDGKLDRWARLLEEPELRKIVEARIEQLSAPQPVVRGLNSVARWVRRGIGGEVVRPPPESFNQLDRREEAAQPNGDETFVKELAIALTWIREGKLSRASEALRSLERRLDDPSVSNPDRALFWAGVGSLRRAENQLPEAETAWRKAVETISGATDSFSLGLRGAVSQLLAQALLTTSWSEAESLFRAALHWQKEGDTPLGDRGTLMSQFARELRDRGRWDEAEALFREAARLEDEGKTTASRRAATLRELARGLRENARASEADQVLLDAEQLDSSQQPVVERTATKTDDRD